MKEQTYKWVHFKNGGWRSLSFLGLTLLVAFGGFLQWYGEARAQQNTEEVRTLSCSSGVHLVDSNEGVVLMLDDSADAQWSASGGIPALGKGPSFLTRFRHVGLPATKSFSVTATYAGNREVWCNIIVQCEAPTCAVPPQGCSYAGANACTCGELLCAGEPSSQATVAAIGGAGNGSGQTALLSVVFVSVVALLCIGYAGTTRTAGKRAFNITHKNRRQPTFHD